MRGEVVSRTRSSMSFRQADMSPVIVHMVQYECQASSTATSKASSNIDGWGSMPNNRIALHYRVGRSRLYLSCVNGRGHEKHVICHSDGRLRLRVSPFPILVHRGQTPPPSSCSHPYSHPLISTTSYAGTTCRTISPAENAARLIGVRSAVQSHGGRTGLRRKSALPYLGLRRNIHSAASRYISERKSCITMQSHR